MSGPFPKVWLQLPSRSRRCITPWLQLQGLATCKDAFNTPPCCQGSGAGDTGSLQAATVPSAPLQVFRTQLEVSMAEQEPTAEQLAQIAAENEEDEHSVNYKPPAQKSIQEIQELDKDDESLRKYKEALLGRVAVSAGEWVGRH